VKPHRQGGLALITVMLIVAIVAGIAAYLSVGQQVWFRQAQNAADRAQIDMLNRGALDLAVLKLAEDGRKNSTDDLTEGWAQPLPPLPTDGGGIVISVQDAQGRFNLNSLWRNGAPSAADIALLQRLLRTQGLNPALTEALLDWIDPDSQTRPGGAEDIEYAQLNPPYRAANQLLQSIDELRLVRGFEAKTVDTLRPYVVALPAPTAINVNTAPAEVLAALLGETGLPALDQILTTREKKPFTDLGPIQALLPTGQAPLAAYGVQTSYFLVTLNTQIGRLSRRTQALIQRPANAPATVLWHAPHYNIASIPHGDEQ
jgi:general secretion pathway protein K